MTVDDRDALLVKEMWEIALTPYMRRLKLRMAKGSIEYGDKSFQQNPLLTVEEIRDELSDVGGWSVVLDDRMARIEEAIEATEAIIDERRQYANKLRAEIADLEAMRRGLIEEAS